MIHVHQSKYYFHESFKLTKRKRVNILHCVEKKKRNMHRNNLFLLKEVNNNKKNRELENCGLCFPSYLQNITKESEKMINTSTFPWN